jgi:hypothetical protein
VHQCMGLPRARTGDDQKGPLEDLGRPKLRGV